MDIISTNRYDNFKGKLYKERRLIPTTDYHPYVDVTVTQNTKAIKSTSELVPEWGQGDNLQVPSTPTVNTPTTPTSTVGANNDRFPLVYEDIFFDVISETTEQKTEPISGLVCYSHMMVIKTNKVSPTIKIGAYILYDEVLYIIKAVSTSKGYNKKSYQWFKTNPNQSSTITMESVQ